LQTVLYLDPQVHLTTDADDRYSISAILAWDTHARFLHVTTSKVCTAVYDAAVIDVISQVTPSIAVSCYD